MSSGCLRLRPRFLSLLFCRILTENKNFTRSVFPNLFVEMASVYCVKTALKRGDSERNFSVKIHDQFWTAFVCLQYGFGSASFCVGIHSWLKLRIAMRNQNFTRSSFLNLHLKRSCGVFWRMLGKCCLFLTDRNFFKKCSQAKFLFNMSPGCLIISERILPWLHSMIPLRN